MEPLSKIHLLFYYTTNEATLSRAHTNFFVDFFKFTSFFEIFASFGEQKQNIYIFLLKSLQFVCIIMGDSYGKEHPYDASRSLL